MPLAPLDNEIVFKKLFQDREVLVAFVRDLIGIEITAEHIQVEKQFNPPIGSVDIKIDIFVEDPQHRLVIEVQRVRYDHHYDRFLYYHNATMLEQVTSHHFYRLHQTVYTIVWLTSRSNDPRYQHGLLTTTLHSENQRGERVPIYPHRLYFLNPHYDLEEVPAGVRDWMMLMRESITDAPQPALNYERAIIRRAASLIDEDGITPQERVKIIESNEAEAHLSSKYQDGRKEGIEEGMQQGIEKGMRTQALATARKLLATFDDEQISEITGLTVAEVRELREQAGSGEA